MSDHRLPSRRHFIKATAALGSASVMPVTAWAQGAPAIVTADALRPIAAQGIQLGDPTPGTMMVWSRSDRPARMLVEWSLDESFRRVNKLIGPYALDGSDFTVRQDLVGLPTGQEVFVRVQFQGLDNSRALSEPVLGHFLVPSLRPRDIRFVWGGDTAGQGWGINTSFGGMKIYEAMRQRNPLFSGDNPRWLRTVSSGPTSSRRKWPRWPRPSTSSVAAIATTCLMRTCAASTPRCRRSGNGMTTRSPTTGRMPSRWTPMRATPRRTCLCSLRAAPGLSWISRRCGPLTRGNRSVSTVSFRMARSSMCSCWTCAATVAPTASIARRKPVLRRPFWVGSNSSGSSVR